MTDVASLLNLTLHNTNLYLNFSNQPLLACSTARTSTLRDLYKRIDEFKKGYQSGTEIVRDENGDLLADSHILNGGKITSPSY
jgi:hypothetical protein